MVSFVFILDFLTILFCKIFSWEHGESKLQLQGQYVIHSIFKNKLIKPKEAVILRKF